MLNFKIFGTEIHISFYFLFMLTFLVLIDRTGLICASFLCVTIHELGHIIALKVLKIKHTKIEFFISTVRITGNIYSSNLKSILLALGGPIANFLMTPFIISEIKPILYFGLCNLSIGLFNLIPAKNLDGGDALYYILKHFKVKKGDFILSIISVISLSFILFLGVYLFLGNRHNPTLIIVAIYLIILSFIKF